MMNHRGKKYKEKRNFINREKKLETQHYRIIKTLMVLGVIYYFLFQPKTIGYNENYFLFVFLLPTSVGIILLGIYRKQFLLNRFLTNKGFFLWTYMIFFYLFQGILFSYLSFGQLASVSWDIINYQEAKYNPEQKIVCRIEDFRSKKDSEIRFKFNGHQEKFKVKFSKIKEYVDENPNDYQLSIIVRKGIWNYFIVDKYTIEKI